MAATTNFEDCDANDTSCADASSRTRISSTVNCGGHSATSCAECPFGDNGSDYGSAWCNGECEWERNTCISRISSTVNCGGHSATSCAECPFGDNGSDYGSAWCNGECEWDENSNECTESTASRTASVLLWYETPSSVVQPAWWFQRVTPIAARDATYFCSNGHKYGYGGIQKVDDATGRVIFSIWDQGGCDQDVTNCDSEHIASTIACGEGVTCTDFGGEGTGRKSYYDLPNFPEMNTDYYFVSQASYLGDGQMEHTGYFRENGSWKLLSRIRVSTNDENQWWLEDLYSFVEQWAADTTWRDEDRSALYGPSVVSSTNGSVWTPIRKAVFDHGTAEDHDRVRAWKGDNHGSIGLATGGSAMPKSAIGTTFTYPEEFRGGNDALADFSSRIPCLNAADTHAQLELCLGSVEAASSGGFQGEHPVTTTASGFHGEHPVTTTASLVLALIVTILQW